MFFLSFMQVGSLLCMKLHVVGNIDYSLFNFHFRETLTLVMME